MKTNTVRSDSPAEVNELGLPTPTCSVRLTAGRIYRGKKPKGCGFPPLCDDRQIKWIGTMGQVQYDSPSVKNGRKYPTVDHEKFLAWVDRDVTEELPEGEWANFPPNA